MKSYSTALLLSSILTTRLVVLVDVEVTTYFLVAPTQVLDEPCESESAKSIAGEREGEIYRVHDKVIGRRGAAHANGGLGVECQSHRGCMGRKSRTM
jgi:hypothetical protein